MKKQIIILLKVLIALLIVVSIVTIVYKNFSKKATDITNKNTVKIDRPEKLKGNIGEYSYDIIYNCTNNMEYLEQGYVIDKYKMPDSPLILKIFPNTNYEVVIQSITIENDNIEINVTEKNIDSSYPSASCINILKNDTTPDFKNIIIKNNTTVYEEIDSNNINLRIGSEGVIKGNEIKYKLDNHCYDTSLDLSKIGYYEINFVNEFNYQYAITLGSFAEGCFGEGIKYIKYNNGIIDIIVGDNIAPVICSDPASSNFDDDSRTHSFCLVLSNVIDKPTVNIKYNDEDMKLLGSQKIMTIVPEPLPKSN